MIHSDAVNLCRLRATELGGILLPMTTGVFFQAVYRNNKLVPDPNGRPVKVGIPGTADLNGLLPSIRPLMCEVKVGKDSLRDDQIKFARAWVKAGGCYIVARFDPGIGSDILDKLNASPEDFYGEPFFND